MITLPLPMIFAGLIGYLLIGSLRDAKHPRVFHLLLMLCALQSALIALAHHYGWPIGPMLPVVACALPPVAWLAFREALFEPITWRRALPHAAVPLSAAVCRLTVPWTLDLVVPLSFACYALAILWSLRPATDLPLARLDAGPLPAMIWRALAAALLLSTLGDLIITAGYLTGHPGWHGPVVSLVSSLSLLLVALLALDRTPTAEDDPAHAPSPLPAQGAERSATTAQDAAEDHALLARLEALMVREQLFLEPDLTLARLARRLTVPAKRLSTAINRTTGENVSRYVNAYRIRHACRHLDQGMPVTEVIYACGFNTKSNFNREFLRVTGCAPTAWISQTAE